MLTRKFEEEEVRRAIFQMETNKAPGLDGFPPEFYQVFWNIIKNYLMTLFEDFHEGMLNINSLNFGTIILLPKSVDAKQIRQYRPICLLNVSFKIFTKVATNRISQVAQKIIRPSQTAFLPGRYIMEGAVILHETLHELHKKKENGVIFKIDFWKAYDKVKYVGSYPRKSEGLIHLVDGCLSILQYVNGTVIFMHHNLEEARNMKLLLCAFEQISIKVNFSASAKQRRLNTLNCSAVKYLGIPMHYRKLRNADWGSVEDKFEKQLNSWKGKLLYVGGQLVLINSVLSSLPMFMMSILEVPRGVLEKMDYYRSRFFWQNDQHKKKNTN
ncbi:hypothetical protein U9M48_041644 [Paspalum notatum var. saurae]|uniref:Reverse transcriptase domain-containing protein n=1 Tax=Paspalum notatum var. saurae TaxID=547442 RepID=A0AAQ3UNT7_PASNO